jgi:hypothetical protein
MSDIGHTCPISWVHVRYRSDLAIRPIHWACSHFGDLDIVRLGSRGA